MPLLPYCYSAKPLVITSGDTFDAELDLGFGVFTKAKVRLRGYTAPLSGQPGFELAQTYLKTLLKSNSSVVVHLDYKNSAGYWEADVQVEGGRSVADSMSEFAENLLIKPKSF